MIASLATLPGTMKMKRRNRRNRLWWFGLMVASFGLGFWAIALVRTLAIPLINIFSSTELVVDPSQVKTVQFLFALSGAVMAGWGLTIMSASSRLSRQLQNYLFFSLTLWFVLDSLASIITGYWINAVLNLGFYLVGILVLYSTMEEYH